MRLVFLAGLAYSAACSKPAKPAPDGALVPAVAQPAAAPVDPRFPLLDLPTRMVDASAFPKPPPPYAAAKGRREVHVKAGQKGPGTADKPTGDLRAAVEKARKGDVIWVHEGTYKAGASDDEFALRLAHAGVTLSAAPNEKVVLEPRGDAGYGISLEADDLVVDGFTLRGFKQASVYFGKREGTVRNVVLARVRITGGIDGIRSLPREGGDAAEPVVKGLLVFDATIEGAQIGFNCGEGPCNDVRLERVQVRGARKAGERGEGSGEDAIAFERGDNVAIVGAEVQKVGADGIDVKATRVAIIASAVRGVGRNGIKLWHGGDVVNCLVHGTGADAAIVFDAGGDYRILHTTVAHHAVGFESYALTAGYDHPDDKGTLRIVSSIFADNAGPVWVSRGLALEVVDSSFSGSRNKLELVRGTEPEVTVGPGGGKPDVLGKAARGVRIGEPPRFVDAKAGNYHLAPQSPARDQGKPDEPYPATDLDGRPRVQGAGADLGCYEGP